MKKRLLSILLSLAMVLTMIPFATMTATAYAEPLIVTAQFDNIFGIAYNNNYVELRKSNEQNPNWTFGWYVEQNDKITINENTISYKGETITAGVTDNGLTSGYAFEGWYINDVKKSDGEITVQDSIVLNPKYTITEPSVTIADILNTADDGFPTNKKDAWVREDGNAVLYKNGENDWAMWFENDDVYEDILLNDQVTQNDQGNYVATENKEYKPDENTQPTPYTVTVTLNMKDDKLVSVNFYSTGKHNASLNGTYAPSTEPTLTIDDILKKAKGGFPTSADKAWMSEDGNKLYINNEKLFFTKDGRDGFEVDLTTKVTSQSDDNYSLDYGNFGKIVFKLNDGKLNAIELTYIAAIGYIGTYEAPKNDSTLKKILIAAGVTAGVTAATVGTIHTVKAIKNYKAEKAAEEAERKAAEEEAKRIAELEAAKALVEATNSVQNKLAVTEKGSIKISFDAVDLEGFRGYEIERATDKAFTKNVKTYNTENIALTNSKNLKKGTRYFYRVRAKVELADGSIAYTDWSNTRSVKATKTR